MVNWKAILGVLASIPMGGSLTGRYFNGLIHGGAVIVGLWLARVIAF